MSKKTPQQKIYFSASIRGEGADPQLAYKVVSHLRSKGYDVLSEHVGSRTQLEMDEILLAKTGVDKSHFSEQKAAEFIRKVDTEWVDEADIMVVVITGASLGVGMEIERALLKPQRGLHETPIYCFVLENSVEGLSKMVKGITDTHFKHLTFTDFENIKEQLDVLL